MPDPELTRRLWILGLGETALGLGLAELMGADANQPVSLPLGLYQPATDHLGHALERAGRFHPIPPGSPTDYVKPRIRSFEPLFFSPAEFTIVRRLTALILGESWARDDGEPSVVQEVAEWIDLRAFSSAGSRSAALALDELHRTVRVAYHGAAAVHELETFDAQKIYREGLTWLRDESRSRHKAEFLDIREKDQLEILAAISDERSNKKDVQTPGTRLFELLKSEIIRGFYTSQAGLKELNFKGNVFYARPPGCNQTKFSAPSTPESSDSDFSE
jgi:Gluconate 2-dehydrogenase subunit 3